MDLSRTLLENLRCPCCGSDLNIRHEIRSTSDKIKDGIVACDCYEYPVVDGIAVLRQMSPVSSIRNEAVELLKQGNSIGALAWLLGNGSATGVPALADLHRKSTVGSWLVRKIRDLFYRNSFSFAADSIPLKNGVRTALHASRPRGYADYLFQRFANPSLLGAISPLIVLGDRCRKTSGKRVFDLLCGVGHASSFLSLICQEIEVVSADSDFVNLFILKNLMAPNATALCVDAEMPLPVKDGAFDSFFCLDGLHYIRSKVALLREVDRILCADGAWLFSHLHNADVANEYPGAPLSAEGYAKRFSLGEHRLMAESEVIKQFQTNGCLDLAIRTDLQSLLSSPSLTLMGSRADILWKRHEGLDEALLRRSDLIGLNPIYQVQEDAESLLLRSAWPSESLRNECTAEVPVLPEQVRIPLSLVKEIAAMRMGNGVSDNVRKLLRSFVLVSLPECYPRPGFRYA